MHILSYPDDLICIHNDDVAVKILLIIFLAYYELLGLKMAGAKQNTESPVTFLGVTLTEL